MNPLWQFFRSCSITVFTVKKSRLINTSIRSDIEYFGKNVFGLCRLFKGACKDMSKTELKAKLSLYF